MARRAKPTGTYRRDCNLPQRDDKNTCIPSERRRLHKPKVDIQSWHRVWGGSGRREETCERCLWSTLDCETDFARITAKTLGGKM